MTDYTTLIDAEIQGFIDACMAFSSPEAGAQGVAQVRADYDAMCRAFHAGHPDGVGAQDRRFGDVPCRVYESGGARAVTIMYFHGGGWVVGGLDSHDDVCAELCAATGLRVVSVDYRLAPEHTHPAAYDDALAATDAVLAQYGGALVVVGDSAGGTLGASLCHARRGGPILGQVLIYPFLGAPKGTASRVDHAHAPLLSAQDMQYFESLLHGGEVTPTPDPTFEPLSDTDMTGIAPTVTFAAECDPLADDARIYAARLADAGGRAVCVDEAGLVHSYLRARHRSARAKASFDRITRAVDALANSDWPALDEPG